jgi:hypothetical protein
MKIALLFALVACISALTREEKDEIMEEKEREDIENQMQEEIAEKEEELKDAWLFWNKKKTIRVTHYCPWHHPYAYKNGLYCCAYNKEKGWHQWIFNNNACDGSKISWKSNCCYKDNWVRCDTGKNSHCASYPYGNQHFRYGHKGHKGPKYQGIAGNVVGGVGHGVLNAGGKIVDAASNLLGGKHSLLGGAVHHVGHAIKNVGHAVVHGVSKVLSFIPFVGKKKDAAAAPKSPVEAKADAKKPVAPVKPVAVKKDAAKPAVEKAAKAVLAADEVLMADEAAEQLEK